MSHHDPIADAKAQEATHKYTFRPATMDDIPALQAMIGESLRALGKGYYTDAELDGSIGYLFGPDTVLIRDQARNTNLLHPPPPRQPHHNRRLRRLVLPTNPVRRQQRTLVTTNAREARSTGRPGQHPGHFHVAVVCAAGAWDHGDAVLRGAGSGGQCRDGGVWQAGDGGYVEWGGVV
ncbi:hypothetical protein M3J09_004105 [Ascochyta lentis]